MKQPGLFPDKFELHPVKAIQYFVGKTSVLFTKVFGGKKGNRFIYIGEKNKK